MDQRVFRRRVLINVFLLVIISSLFVVKLSTLHFSGKIILDDNKKSEIRRGYIKDKKGYILALSIETYSLFCNPREIINPEETAKILGPILGKSGTEIAEKLAREKRFVWLERKLDDDTMNRVKVLEMPGLYFKKENKRVYPHNELVSNILGFVGVDNIGLEGIEYGYDAVLRGMDISDADANSEYGIKAGSNIVLTIDRFIQYRAEQELEKAVKYCRAKQGAVIIEEVKTGRILAFARYPNYNPNFYFNYTDFERRNFTIIDSFEPGSTMKIISLAAILEKDPAVLNKTFQCQGSIDISDATINCTGVHGNVAMYDIIRKSCNVGIIKAMKVVSREDMYMALKKFGFGRKVGGELPGETEGILRTPDTWSGLSKYSMSIGHEFSVTSLQLAAAFGAVANGGVYMVPSIIEAIEAPDGTIKQSFFPRTRGRVISGQNARILMKMMRGVVKDGTGKEAASLYYDVVGKTGTSQKFIRKGGYYSDRVVASFIGIAPYSDPEVCILVVIDDPLDKGAGGIVAAPVFSKIVDRILPYAGVKESVKDAKIPIHKKGKGGFFDGKSIPDFTQLSLPEVLDLLVGMGRHHDINYQISGTGRVFSQNPRPGTLLKGRDTLIIYFK